MRMRNIGERTDMSIYLVKEEDTIDKIAGLYDVSVEEIAYINQIPYPYRLAVGEALLIPDGVSPGVIMTTSSAGGFLCGYKPVVLAGSKEPLKIRHAHSYHRQALTGFSLCLIYWLTRKRVYVLFQ